jgi:2-oxoglutarate ferredoxin oxidoreductase subunit alpha
VIRVNSHVHDTDGITTEEPVTTISMADKRQKKMAGLAEETGQMGPVAVSGNKAADRAILCWGSTKGVCDELGTAMGLRVVRPVVLWPFPEKAFAAAMAGVREFRVVEENETGQLGRLVREFGYTPAGKVLKYDGRPFFVEELERDLKGGILT